MDVRDASALLGCMGFGGTMEVDAWGPVHVDAAAVAVDAALDAGIRWFDHADIYRHGRAEIVFGEVLARWSGIRERIGIQTKCGIRLARGGLPGMYDLRAETIAARVRDSLARLRVDYLDVLLLHRPDPLAEPAEIARALTRLHAEGLIRQVGVSNMSGAQIAELQRHLKLPLVANQLEMSLHRRAWLEAGVLLNTAESARTGFPHGTLEYCAAHGVALQAWGPLAQGRYTGRPETPQDRDAAAMVAELAAAKGTTPETVVLWWLRRHPSRPAPVIGTTNPDRIRACRDAVTREPDLTHEEWYELWIAARGTPIP